MLILIPSLYWASALKNKNKNRYIDTLRQTDRQTDRKERARRRYQSGSLLNLLIDLPFSHSILFNIAILQKKPQPKKENKKGQGEREEKRIEGCIFVTIAVKTKNVHQVKFMYLMCGLISLSLFFFFIPRWKRLKMEELNMPIYLSIHPPSPCSSSVYFAFV